jgi:RNA polymerase sigma-70 factor (family 1)
LFRKPLCLRDMQKDYADYNYLLDPLKERNIDAFNLLHETFRNKLLVLALYIIGNEESAKDLVQEFFVDFWENRMYEKINGSLKIYLIHAVRNRAIKFKKKLDNIARYNNYIEQSAIQNTTPLHAIENEELKNELETAIQNLPPMASKVFRLHYQEHLSHKEIAEQLHISTSTVSSHIDRALKELRINLKKN